MPKIVHRKSTAKAYMWRVNPDKSTTKYSHKKYDGSTRKTTRKI